jgi:hypothetical protein
MRVPPKPEAAPIATFGPPDEWSSRVMSIPHVLRVSRETNDMWWFADFILQSRFRAALRTSSVR